jgi:prephenate dehydrogenase
VSAALDRVLVVGAGLLGTSIGLALRTRGVTVYLSDTNGDAVDHAVGRGAGEPDPFDWQRVHNEPQVDLLVVAVPPQVTPQVLRIALAGGVARAVTDVSSVKSGLIAAVADLPAARRYVGSHPMAGREVSGPLAAEDSLFQARPWVVCPSPTDDPDAVELVTTLALLAGARPVRMSAEEHDAAVALVSHAPHVVAALVAGRLANAPEGEVRLAGPGVQDVTRIAASDPSLWRQILPANADAVAAVLRQVRDDLDVFLVALGQGDDRTVAQLLHTGVAGRARLPGKHGGIHREFVNVPVRLADRPGQLARLFGDVEEACVNVEDIRIEHVPGEPVGLVELAVRPTDVVRLRDALVAGGWSVPLVELDATSLEEPGADVVPKEES